VFVLIALAIPVVLVGGTELGLRAAGFGGYGATFHVAATLPDGRKLIAADNQRVDTFFFNNRDLPGQLNPTFFWEPKPAGTLRVIVVGESAIRGFPQPPSLISTAFLEAMLRDALPDRSVEVINLGTTAIASFPILELGTEALAQHPDVLVVQMGNNEFFGAYGVASLNRAGNSPIAIAFQRWGKSMAIVQGARALVVKMRGPPKTPANSSATLMERMMGRDYTGPDDPIRGAAARNIRAHLHELIRRCEARGVPVVVCITGTNERGMAPLGTSTTDSVPAQDKARFDEVLTITPEQAGERIEDLRWAVGVAPNHARAHWLLGTAMQSQGTFEEARVEFQRAIDLDPMPWRGTSAIHAAMREAMEGTGAVLADAQESLRKASENGGGGSIGWDLMADHVHMSVAGQAIVGRAIFDAIARIPSVGISADAPNRLDTNARYAERLGATIWDEHGVSFRMWKLLKVPFFERTNPWAARIMEDRMAALEQDMTESERAAVHAWQNPKLSQNYVIPPSAFIGEVCMKEQRYDQGERAYKGAALAITRYSYVNLEFTYRWLGCRLRAHGSLDEEGLRVAREAIDRGLVMIASADTSAKPLHRYVGSLYALVGDCASALPHLQEGRYAYKDMELVQVDAQIVECLVKLGRIQDAQQIIEYGSARAGQFAPAYRDMTRLLKGGGGAVTPSVEPPRSPSGPN